MTPGARLPLRVFEPRYVALLRAVLDPHTGSREFGVIGIKLGHEVGSGAARALFDVGCTASVDHLVASGESQFAVLSTGRRRFELVGVDESAGTPYLTGLVRFLDEPAGDAGLAAVQLERVRGELARYLSALGEEPAEVPADPLAASYRVPDLARLGLADRARLLAAPPPRHGWPSPPVFCGGSRRWCPGSAPSHGPVRSGRLAERRPATLSA